MKHYLLPLLIALTVTSLSMLASCSKNDSTPQPAEGEFLITGQLPAERFDSAILYLVPMEGPHPRPVDSVFIGQDGKFMFSGNVEQVAVLRVEMYRRIGIQDLLVVTEPGVTHVTLDSVSSAYGTPQNEALQQWKEWREAMSRKQIDLATLRKKVGKDSEQYTTAHTQLRAEQGEFNYQFLKGLGRQTVSIFLYKMFMGDLDSLRHAELDVLLKDTTDYTQPQPGFRR